MPPIADGKSIFAFAQAEPQARFALDDVATMATRADDGWRITGRKDLVLGAPWADTLLVTARMSGRPARPGRHRRLRRAGKVGRLEHDSVIRRSTARAPATSTFKDVAQPRALLGDSEDALPAIEKAADNAITAMASEAVGCMQVLLDTTIAYTKQRIQFGKPLADNQVLRHRMASMAVKLEEARASALNAILNVDADPLSPGARRLQRQGEGRPGRAVRRRAGGAAARRHGRHRGAECRRLLQAVDGDRRDLRLAGISSAAPRAAVAPAQA